MYIASFLCKLQILLFFYFNNFSGFKYLLHIIFGKKQIGFLHKYSTVCRLKECEMSS